MSEKTQSKIEQVHARYLELKAENLKPKEIFMKLTEEFNISARSARSYVWRVEQPEKYKELLKRYFDKKGQS